MYLFLNKNVIEFIPKSVSLAAVTVSTQPCTIVLYSVQLWIFIGLKSPNDYKHSGLLIILHFSSSRSPMSSLAHKFRPTPPPNCTVHIRHNFCLFSIGKFNILSIIFVWYVSTLLPSARQITSIKQHIIMGSAGTASRIPIGFLFLFRSRCVRIEFEFVTILEHLLQIALRTY